MRGTSSSPLGGHTNFLHVAQLNFSPSAKAPPPLNEASGIAYVLLGALIASWCGPNLRKESMTRVFQHLGMVIESSTLT